ncbi:MAG: 16S rRNA (cytosine(1402)-N(4))-methyltransferase RsmH [bacterium]|nr:16S rRNA (cytosine(1402)-N(4))-methyltransferase RsmH [bacterium]
METNCVQHKPVLLREVVTFLQPERGGLFVDCTVGLGGHTEAILEASAQARVLGVDRDPQALGVARRRLERFGPRLRLVQADFADLPDVLEQLEEGLAAGVLADLGVSSLQLDSAERGFSFRWNGPLDMRMGNEGPTAADVVNTYSEEELRNILWQHGEERQARRIARALAEERDRKPLETTDDLKRVVYRAKAGGRSGRRGRREGRVDPATRVFQALRIEVNKELSRLETLLDEVIKLVEAEGRLVVISYHSLEDRLVKNSLRRLARGKIDEITGRPHSETRVIEVLTKKPVRPSVEEIEINPRARSARLRAARRL